MSGPKVGAANPLPAASGKVPVCLAMLAALALLFIASAHHSPPLLIWNATASAPIGLYRIEQTPPRVGDLVLVRLAGPIAALAYQRAYLPRSTYLLKPVSAVSGDRVCRFGSHILVRDRLTAIALASDTIGCTMPMWHGCRTLQPEELFLLAEHAASFDGRYFGPLSTQHVAGRAVHLWPRSLPQ